MNITQYKYLIILFTSLLLAQNTLSNEDILDASEMIKKYEKMFHKMLDDVNTFDNQQLFEYEKLLQENLLNQFNQFQLSSDLYSWKDLGDSRSLIINGTFLEDGKTIIEVKDKQLFIKGSLENSNRKEGPIRYIQISIPTPSDCDETSIKFEKLKGRTHIIFKKVTQKRTPLIKGKVPPTI